jgi:energy-coupling factor transporter ATP-binding protein EcfA2
VSLLEARDLEVAPPGSARSVIHGVSLDLEPGEWLALAGANGCGKSTLALALGGLVRPRRGTLAFRGLPLSPDARDSRREIGVVLQDASTQLLQSTVRDELAFTLRNLDAPEAVTRASVASWAARLGLAEKLDLDPRTLSAGGQQLVLLGAALAANPVLLVADEPMAHIDPVTRERTLAVMREAVGEGLALVWVTQDPIELEAAHRTLQMGAQPRPGLELPPGSEPAGPVRLRVWIGAPPASGPAVRIPGLTDLEILSSGTTALVGPNGSGKSTLLAAIAGLVSIEQVRIDWDSPPATRPILASQHPETQIFEERVADELRYAAIRRGRPEAEVQASILQHLTEAGLHPSDFLERRCWTLSSGEKRFIAVLGALIAPASVVLLDEPTAGLDSRLKEVIGREVARRSRTDPVVVASQDRNWIRAIGAVVRGGVSEPSNSPSCRQKTD